MGRLWRLAFWSTVGGTSTPESVGSSRHPWNTSKKKPSNIYFFMLNCIYQFSSRNYSYVPLCTLIFRVGLCQSRNKHNDKSNHSRSYSGSLQSINIYHEAPAEQSNTSWKTDDPTSSPKYFQVYFHMTDFRSVKSFRIFTKYSLTI